MQGVSRIIISHVGRGVKTETGIWARARPGVNGSSRRFLVEPAYVPIAPAVKNRSLPSNAALRMSLAPNARIAMANEENSSLSGASHRQAELQIPELRIRKEPLAT